MRPPAAARLPGRRSRAHCTCLAAELAQLEQQECAEASAMLWRSSGVILGRCRLTPLTLTLTLTLTPTSTLTSTLTQP